MRRHRESLGRPGRLGLWTLFRFNPHVLVVLATVLALFYIAREAIPCFIFWHYRSTYRQVDFVMNTANENEGYPYARGVADPGGEEWVMSLAKTPAGYVVESDPTVGFAPGRRIRVWVSDAAFNVGYGKGRSTTIAPVSRFPTLPGLGRLFAWAGLFVVTGLAGLWVAGRSVFRPRILGTETLYDTKAPEKRE
jgi:hypothetical protein